MGLDIEWFLKRALERLDAAKQNYRTDEESSLRRSEAIGGAEWFIDRALELASVSRKAA